MIELIVFIINNLDYWKYRKGAAQVYWRITKGEEWK
jgi:hypothetical protein